MLASQAYNFLLRSGCSPEERTRQVQVQNKSNNNPSVGKRGLYLLSMPFYLKKSMIQQQLVQQSL